MDIAILSPVRDVWLNYVRSLDRKSVEDLEKEFEYLIGNQLRKNGVTFHFLDEIILNRYGSVEGDALRVGEMVYNTVLIPKMQNLMKDTYRLLKAYQGKLCILALPKYMDGTLADVDLVSNITIDEIIQSRHTPFFCGDGRCFMTRRESTLGDFLFVKNLSPKNDSTVILENIAIDKAKICPNDEELYFNAFRIETDGGERDKHLFALCPTMQPQFHVPAAFECLNKYLSE